MQLRNTVSGDTYIVVAATVEELESNERVELDISDLASEEWEVQY